MSELTREEGIATARLEALAGQWQVEGDVYKGANKERWRSEERYEWLPGERFLVNHWDARVGERDFKGMAVFGCDDERGYFAHFYDNGGNSPEYRVKVEGARIEIAGDSQRATYEFEPRGEKLRIHWDVRDAKGWQPLCDLTAKRKSGSEPDSRQR